MSKSEDSRTKKDHGWWKSLSNDDECPITLEPLSALPHPPFELYYNTATRASSEGGIVPKTTISYYFDGYALASYIVSRAIFLNPLTRQALTMEDCRRLDDYLDRYWKSRNSQENGSYQTRMVRVAEAFALREMVQVSTTNSNNAHATAGQGYQEQEQINRIRRAEVLRSEATSALAGLFVFSSQRNTSRQFAARREPSDVNNNSNNAPVPEFGFDLYCTRPDTNAAVDEMEGLTIIDDDEVIVLSSESQKYEQIQASFPPLSSSEERGDTPLSVLTPDLDLLKSLKTTAALTQRQEAHRQSRLQAGKQQLSMEAVQRQQERVREREQRKQLYSQQQAIREREQEERHRAQEELEHWRNEQWEQLRLLTEAQQKRMKAAACKPEPVQETTDTSVDLISKEEKEKLEKKEMEDQINRQKAKAAEKRKRAKVRKQAKKAEEIKEAREKERKAALKKEKEASASKCAACGDGILDCGFEKKGNKFCSTKCARAGPSSS